MNFEGARAYMLSRLEVELKPELSYHNVRHTLDVEYAVQEIAKGEGIEEEEILKLLRTAAIFHDAGFVLVYEGHEEESCQLVSHILPGFGYSVDQVATVSRLIMATRLPQSPTDLLSQILCDADLDYLGREDYPVISEMLFKEFYSLGRVSGFDEWILLQMAFLSSHQYFTEYSKKHRQPAHDRRLQMIRNSINP